MEACHYGVVFTAHPTFANPAPVVRAMAGLAAGVSADGTPLTAGARAATLAAAASARHRPAAITLADEYALAGEAIAGAEGALARLHAIVLEVARDAWPDRWRELCPRIVSLASWVGYDHDGRSDIGWAETLRIRLRAKLAQLDARHAACTALIGNDEQTRAGRTLAEAAARLQVAAEEVRGQIAAAEGAGEDTVKAEAFARRLVDGRERALTGTGEIADLLARAQAEADADGDGERAVGIAVERAGLTGRGLADAHCHFRLNAAQLHNAIRAEVGLEGSPGDPARRRSYANRVNDLIAGAVPVTVNIGSLLAERASARRMFMMIAEIAKHIDAESPVRFLIAETESAFTLLAALYFARLFGVDHLVEISPLFETESALQKGDQMIADALASKHFRDYVQKLRPPVPAIRLFDSGRYVGQMAATFGIERLRLRIAAVLARHGLRDVQVVLFDTHGESIGRGGHPASMADRLRYLAPPAGREAFAEAGVGVKEESSFQGGDGYLRFLAAPLAFATIARIVEARLGPDPEDGVDDPVYADADFASEFFAVVRQSFGALLDDPDYAALLGMFSHGLSDNAGSRPARRQHEFQPGGRAFAHPSQMRAIGNNTVLHQLGFLANTVTGLGRAAARDPERFGAMRRASPRFARAIAMAEAALTLTDPDVLRAYVDTFDPGMWLARAAHAREADRRAELRAIAAHLEKTAVHGRLVRVYRKLLADDLPLRETYRELGREPARGRVDLRSARGAAPTGEDREALGLLHALRIAVIQRAWLTAMHIPDFTPVDGIDRDGLIQRILHLEGAEAGRASGAHLPAPRGHSVRGRLCRARVLRRRGRAHL